MKRASILFFLILAGPLLFAQDPSSDMDTVKVDVVKAPQVDSLLAMRGLYASLSRGVTVNESDSVRAGFLSVVAGNSGKEDFTGFRIKLFQSSAQTAREESEKLVADLAEWYPALPVYRSFSSPYFKVTAGDFRTRVDAGRFLRVIRGSFPTATIVREKMKYPYLD